MNPGKVKCWLLKELISRIPWETALEDEGAQQSWQIFQDALHRKQELTIPRCKKSGKEGKRLACWSGRRAGDAQAAGAGTNILGRVLGYCQVVQGQGEEGKVQMELNVARDMKNSKGLYRCVSMKRKGQSRCDTSGRLVTMDEKVEETSLSISHEW